MHQPFLSNAPNLLTGLVNPGSKRRDWRHCATGSGKKAGSIIITRSSGGNDWESRVSAESKQLLSIKALSLSEWHLFSSAWH